MIQETNPSVGSSAHDIKVAVIEDHHKFRECLEFLLNNTEGYRCVGSFRSMEEALEKIQFDLPDVALVDIGLPGMSGVEGVRVRKGRWTTSFANGFKRCCQCAISLRICLTLCGKKDCWRTLTSSSLRTTDFTWESTGCMPAS